MRINNVHVSVYPSQERDRVHASIATFLRCMDDATCASANSHSSVTKQILNGATNYNLKAKLLLSVY